MKKILSTLAIISAALFTVGTLAFVLEPQALAMTVQEGVQSARGTDVPSELFGDGGVFTTVVNILLFIIGAVSVIMLIVGGLRYTISAGNQTAVTGAKNTILYAIVGLVVAFFAYAIINFVLSAVSGGSGGTNV